MSVSFRVFFWVVCFNCRENWPIVKNFKWVIKAYSTTIRPIVLSIVLLQSLVKNVNISSSNTHKNKRYVQESDLKLI